MSNVKKFAFFCIGKLPIKLFLRSVEQALNTYKTVPIEKCLGKTRQICDRLAFLSNINKNALLQIKLPYKSFFNLYAF